MAPDQPEKVSPEEAVRRAFWMVKVPSMAFLVVPLLAMVILMDLGLIPRMGAAGARWGIPTLVIAFVGAWVIWSVQVPRWRVWAYRVVDDIPELKRLAVEAQIIWPDGHLFEKTEFRSSSQARELRRLEGREPPETPRR